MSLDKDEQKNLDFDFIDGQRDCIDGNTCDMSRSQRYIDGFSAQYEWEQVKGSLKYGSK